MNGGSNTAANGVSAVMRGIQRQRIKINGEERPGLEAFDYISALSGGNIPNALYHFSQFATTDELLDLDTPGYTDPTTITMEELGVAPPIKSIFSRVVVDPMPFVVLTVIYVTTFGGPFWPTLQAFWTLHFYGVFIGTPITSVKIRDEVKSKPFFQTAVVGPADVFPAWVDNKINRGVFGELYREAPLGALKLNQHISDEYGQSIYEMNITYVMSLAEKHGYQLPIPAFGSHEALHVPFSAGPVTMMFDAVENETDATSVEFEGFVAPYDELSTESDPVTVEKVLGMATDLLVLVKDYRSIIGELGNTPITFDMPTADGGKRSMAVTDGGYYDNSGLPALLQQGVRKIVFSFVPSPGAYGNGGLANNLVEYFGLVHLLTPLDSYGVGNRLHHLFNNENSKGAGRTRFEEMINDFNSLREADEPMITTLKDLEVVDNPLFGIKGGWTVDLTIIAGTEVPMKFVEMLPAGVAEPPIGQNKTVVDGFGGIRFTNEEFFSVPNVIPLPMDGGNYTYTIPGTDTELELEGFPGLGNNLPVKAARMTELMLTWMIEYAWDKPLVGSDGEVKFDGFRAFLEEEPHAHDDDEKEEDGSDSSSNFARTSPFMYLMVLAVSMLYWII